jgi:hypothetical protein
MLADFHGVYVDLGRDGKKTETGLGQVSGLRSRKLDAAMLLKHCY